MKLNITRLNDRLEHCLMIFFSIFMFFDGYCYLTWSTLNNHIINLLAKYMRIVAVFSLFIYILYKKAYSKKSVNLKTFYSMIIFFILIIFLVFKDYSWKSEYTTIVAAFTFILLSIEQREYIFKASMIAFALMILPSLIYYLLNIIGINIPHTVLQSNQIAKYERGWTYLRYPLGLITQESNIGQIDRYCGIFDESGYVGTLAALFIAGGYGKVNKKWIILLALEGVFSLSVAFYLMISISFLVRTFLKGAVKLGVVIIVLMVGFTIFINTDFDSPLITHIQDRIDVTSIFFVKDNRTSGSADVVLDNFFHTGGMKLLVGNGHGAANNNSKIYGSSSYKMFIYDYGIIGMALFAMYFASILFLIKKVNISVLPFIIVFLASWYQRPYVFTVVYIAIFAGAVSLHLDKELIGDNEDKYKVFNLSHKKLIN